MRISSREARSNIYAFVYDELKVDMTNQQQRALSLLVKKHYTARKKEVITAKRIKQEEREKQEKLVQVQKQERKQNINKKKPIMMNKIRVARYF